MLSSEHFALMDKRLKLIYNPKESFSGKNILLSGSFMQMKCIGGKSLCSSMYNAQRSDQITIKSLFSQFTIFNMTHQIRTKYKSKKIVYMILEHYLLIIQKVLNGHKKVECLNQSPKELKIL